MIFVDDWKGAIDTIMHPGKNTGNSMDIMQSLSMYYKVSLIPAVIFIILALVAAGAVSSALGSALGSIGSGAAGLLLIGIGLVFLWIAIPIGLMIDAALLHLFGKFILKSFKGTYNNTFAGFVYGELPIVALFWVALVLSIISPLLGLIVLIILGVWTIIVGIIALAGQNKTTAVNVIIAAVLEFVVIFIINTLL